MGTYLAGLGMQDTALRVTQGGGKLPAARFELNCATRIDRIYSKPSNGFQWTAGRDESFGVTVARRSDHVAITMDLAVSRKCERGKDIVRIDDRLLLDPEIRKKIIQLKSDIYQKYSVDVWGGGTPMSGTTLKPISKKCSSSKLNKGARPL